MCIQQARNPRGLTSHELLSVNLVGLVKDAANFVFVALENINCLRTSHRKHQVSERGETRYYCGGLQRKKTLRRLAIRCQSFGLTPLSSSLISSLCASNKRMIKSALWSENRRKHRQFFILLKSPAKPQEHNLLLQTMPQLW